MILSLTLSLKTKKKADIAVLTSAKYFNRSTLLTSVKVVWVALSLIIGNYGQCLCHVKYKTNFVLFEKLMQRFQYLKLLRHQAS